MRIPSEWGVFKFERNIVTAAMNYLSLSSPKVPDEQEFEKVRSTKCSKMSDEGKKLQNCW
jgi:hypothetical protein